MLGMKHAKKAKTLKQRLISAPIMTYPVGDIGQYIRVTNAFGVAIDAVPSQVQDCDEKVIPYANRVLKPSETKY